MSTESPEESPDNGTPGTSPSGPEVSPTSPTASEQPPDSDAPSASPSPGQEVSAPPGSSEEDPTGPTGPADSSLAPGTGSDVVPTIVYAGSGPDSRVTVNGYVARVIEDGGTCSAVLTGATTTSTASAPAFADATATWCGELVLEPVDGDTSGWRVVVTYSSQAHRGASTSTAVSTS